jgi:hypothetical protein
VGVAAAGRIAVAVALVIGGIVGCAHNTSANQGAGSAGGGAALNNISASQVIGAIGKAGLPALNPHDVTAQQCPKLHCAQAIETDTVSVFKFPITGLAQKYAGSTSNVYQIEDIVLGFKSTVTDGLKQDYERVVEGLAA